MGDNDLNIMPGVTVEDMGYKMGLNGVDNAKLSFDNVRIPRENLLNRYSDVLRKESLSPSLEAVGKGSSQLLTSYYLAESVSPLCLWAGRRRR